MQKLLALILVLAFITGLSSCGESTGIYEFEVPPTSTSGSTPITVSETKTPRANNAACDIALVIDHVNINDNDLTRESWKGVRAYCDAAQISCNYYSSIDNSYEARIDAINRAAENGAGVIVCAGPMYSAPVFWAQSIYPDMQFLIIDGVPADPDDPGYAYISENTHAVNFREEQSGYLAGYAAVMEGHRNLGFFGAEATPAVIRYSYGFIQGADGAARFLELPYGDVTVRHWYSGDNYPNDYLRPIIDSWFAEGIDLIFACGGSIYISAIAAASDAGGSVICAESDKAVESDLVLTTALRNISVSVEGALYDLFANGGVWDEGRAGVNIIFGAQEGSVGLPDNPDYWRFKYWSISSYYNLLDDIKNGSTIISGGTDTRPGTFLVETDYYN